MKIVTTDQMRRLEQTADQGGLAYATMMDNAGAAVADVIAERFAADGARVLVLVGPGNNGGDGLVTARRLHDLGYQVRVYVWRRGIDEDENFRLADERKIPVGWAEKDKSLSRLKASLKEATIIVDALLGTGASRPIEGLLAGMLSAVAAVRNGRSGLDEGRLQPLTAVPEHRAAGELVPALVAVDVPSGLDCDSGQVDPATLAADLTVTFAYPKVGQFSNDACGVLGDLIVADIGIPPALAADVGLELVTAGRVSSLLPARPRCSHKGTFGKALIIAGSVNYTGAACLAASAAGRAGAGLVTLGIPRAIQSAVAPCVVEATYLLLPHDMGVLNADAVGLVREKLKDYEALLVGPGLTSEKETIEFVRNLLGLRSGARRSQIGFGRQATGAEETPETDWTPLVLDADALNALAGQDGWWQNLPANTIITPHPGEMSRLIGRPVAEIERDRVRTAEEAASIWGHIVILKGAHTVVAEPGGRTVLSPFANPALATAGTGDVLSGTIVSLLAQGLKAFDAAIAGVYVHGLAGELVRRDIGVSGALASDLLDRIPAAMRLLRGE